MIERLLSEALTERLKQPDLADCYVIDIVARSNKRVEVYIDSDSHFSLDRCKTVSRYLENLIEENQWLPEKYVLEVSSPGLDRPLAMKRQYRKNIGRHIKIETEDDRQLEGQLVGIEDNTIIVETKKERVNIEFDDIRKARIIARFK